MYNIGVGAATLGTVLFVAKNLDFLNVECCRRQNYHPEIFFKTFTKRNIYPQTLSNALVLVKSFVVTQYLGSSENNTKSPIFHQNFLLGRWRLHLKKNKRVPVGVIKNCSRKENPSPNPKSNFYQRTAVETIVANMVARKKFFFEKV